MKICVFLIVLVSTLNLQAQTKLVIGQSDTVDYVIDEQLDEHLVLDSIVIIDLKGKNPTCENLEVYFDNSMEKIAYKSFTKEDSCFNIYYRRGGNLKKINKFKLDSTNNPVWVWTESYCKNGQLTFKGKINHNERQHNIIYYCNGNKRIEFDHLGWGADGKMTTWFENGQISSETYYDNNIEVGEWKYYDEEGNLIKIEHYKDGKLVETVKN